jgi:hypothetical protein
MKDCDPHENQWFANMVCRKLHGHKKNITHFWNENIKGLFLLDKNPFV